MTTQTTAREGALNKGFDYCLWLLIFLIPFQPRYYHWLKGFSHSLINSAWQLPAYFEIHIDLFLADFLLVALLMMCRPALWEGERKYLSLFLVVGLVSILGSTLPAYPLHYWRWLHLVLPAGLFFVLGARRVDFRMVALIVVAASLVEAGIAICQYFTQHSLGLKGLGEPTLINRHEVGPLVPIADGAIWIGDHWFHGPRGRSFLLRASGTLPHPNILGGVMVFGLIMTYYLYEMARKKVGWALALLVQLFCLFVTYSRSALYALVVVTLFWAFCQKRLSSLLWVVGAGFCLCTALLYPQLFERGGVVSYTAVAQVSDVQRLSLHEVGWDLIKAHPVLGVGFNSYMLATKEAAYLHNVYLHLASEMGVVALGCFALFCLFLLKRGWQGRFQLERLAPLCVFLAMLGIGLVDHYPLCDPSARLIFFLTGGLLYSFPPKVRKFDNAERGGFAFDPAQPTIEKLEAGRVKCKGALSAKSKF
jgi:O-antigen ligase/polysaccharide polymerase Wzy-like membrane protein